jgi:hypothetical protein
MTPFGSAPPLSPYSPKGVDHEVAAEDLGISLHRLVRAPVKGQVGVEARGHGFVLRSVAECRGS